MGLSIAEARLSVITAPMTKQLGALLGEYRRRLERAGVFAPFDDARALLAYALDMDESEICASSGVYVDDGKKEIAEQLVRRREKREPLTRILGATTFYGLTIKIAKETFRPCPEAEAVVEHMLLAVEPRKNDPLHILDLGTGTGCVLLALLNNLPNATGVGVDVDEVILNVARTNAEVNRLQDCAKFVVGDWGKQIDEKFDLVVCTPPAAATDNIPYMAPEMRDHDPHVSLNGGKDGLDFFRYVAKDMRRLAKSDGLGLFQIYSSHREARIFRKEGFQTEVKRNYLGNPCCIIVFNNKGRKSLWRRLVVMFGGRD